MDAPEAGGRRWAQTVDVAVCVAVASVVATAVAGAAVLEGRLHQLGRGDLAPSGVVSAVYLAAIASAGVVGVTLAVRRAGHPVAWCFLALAAALAVGAVADRWARVGAVARPGSLPGADAAAHLVDPLFVVYFTTVAAALHLTPTGRPLTARWGWAVRTTVLAATLGYVGGALSDRSIDPPFAAVRNPLAVAALGDLPAVAREVGAALAAVGLLVGAASLVIRYRRARGAARQQLLWLSLAALPLPPLLAVVFAFRNGDDQTPLLLATAGWIVVIPVATGLSISRYHLFDVDRILSRTFSWALLSALLVATYAVVVVIVGEASGGRAGSSTITAVLGTLVAVSVAAPARRVIQDALDRRFNRRRFDALRLVEAHLRQPAGGPAIDDVLRRALGDPTLAVAYWMEDRRRWVDGDGRAAPPDAPGVEVQRRAQPVARLSFDGTRVARPIAEAVAARALPELDNARLRAAISLQLVEVADSRARIARAQLAERHRLERNLHDGAQQRLLALGFELQAAQLNGQPERLAAAVAAGIEQARAALVELRDLANGLSPAVLSDGGLAAALDDLVGRNPDALDVRCPETRLAPDVEATAWFVICEAVANARKHAAPHVVQVDVDHREDGWLAVTVQDDGCGGADPAGSGLEGLRDRVEAAGGSLEVDSPSGAGTTVRARLPPAHRR